jgi:hypothetical protein
MTFPSCIREGFQIAARHKRVVIVLWMVPMIPAVVLAVMASANLMPNLGPSIFADRVLDGDWFVVWSEFRSSPGYALAPILTTGVVVMAFLSLLANIVVAAGVVEVVLEREESRPFMIGVRRNFLSFARTTFLLSLGTAVSGLAAWAVVRGSFKLAAAKADGRLDLAGVAVGAVVFLLLWAPQYLAADFSRIAAARHGDRSMTRGYFRALAAVLRRPGTFAPLFATFLLLPLVLNLCYFMLRAPWTPSTAFALVMLILAQQIVMVVRAMFELGFWGAEVAAFRGLDEPRWCRAKIYREQTAVQPAAGDALPESAAS